MIYGEKDPIEVERMLDSFRDFMTLFECKERKTGTPCRIIGMLLRLQTRRSVRAAAKFTAHSSQHGRPRLSYASPCSSKVSKRPVRRERRCIRYWQATLSTLAASARSAFLGREGVGGGVTVRDVNPLENGLAQSAAEHGHR